MDEIELNLEDLVFDDTLVWDDEPVIGELLIALRHHLGQRVKVRIFHYHESVGPNWGHQNDTEDKEVKK